MSLLIRHQFLTPDERSITGVVVTITPTYRGAFVAQGGTWASELGSMERTSDGLGEVAFRLLWPSELDPDTTGYTVQCVGAGETVTWSGVVPEGVVGPLSLHDLKESHAWGLVSTPAAPVLAIQGASGAQQEATTTTIGGVLIDAAPQSGHPIAATAPSLLAETINRMTGEAGATVFNNDGSITTTYSPSGLVVVTTFGNSTITEVYGAPVSQTKTTTFNNNGSITEVLA